ncbi:MAG: hypothetical protein H6835_11870 [Planctomycetes bacterium]|nr:hypothetical protein [Planctomycetota bacterium]
MTDTGTSDLASLEPLEPLDGAMAGAPAEDLMAHNRAGLAAPAHSLYCRDKSFYRFLFAGVMMFVGCCMPWTAEIGRAGYQTMAGGFYMLIAIAMVWSWWASIANNRPVSMKWLLFTMVPLVGSAMALFTFNVVDAAQHAKDHGLVPMDMTFSESWSTVFKDMGSAIAKNAEAPVRVEGFWRLLGPGNVLVFLGALLAEAGFVMGVVGGAKQNKDATKAKMAAAAERRRK